MSASSEVVARVQEALGCARKQLGIQPAPPETPWRCWQHSKDWTDRGCPVAVAAADAAIEALP
jgi:hypothetical protein